MSNDAEADSSKKIENAADEPDTRLRITKWITPNSADRQLYDIALPSRRRGWMDVNNGHAYKCMPLSVANGFGWEILNPVRFDAIWNGCIGSKNAIKFNYYPENDEERNYINGGGIKSHFGNGIITFSHLDFILRTTAGHNIFLKGPTNHFKHGAQALEAIIESDWLPYTFTLNWKITRKNSAVYFEKGEPLACLFPFPRNYLESFEAMEVKGEKDSDFSKEFAHWSQKRRELHNEERKDGKSREHFYYNRGIENAKMNEKFAEHQKSIIGCPFAKMFGGGKPDVNEVNPHKIAVDSKNANEKKSSDT